MSNSFLPKDELVTIDMMKYENIFLLLFISYFSHYDNVSVYSFIFRIQRHVIPILGDFLAANGMSSWSEFGSLAMWVAGIIPGRIQATCTITGRILPIRMTLGAGTVRKGCLTLKLFMCFSCTLQVKRCLYQEWDIQVNFFTFLRCKCFGS